MKGLHINFKIAEILCFFNFFIKLVFAINLQIYQLIRISKPVHSLIEPISIRFAHIIEVTFFVRLWIKVVDYSDVSTNMQIIRLLLSYLFKIITPILYFCFIIFINIIFSFYSFKDFSYDVWLSLSTSWIVFGYAYQFVYWVFRQRVVLELSEIYALFVYDHSRFTKYFGFLLKLTFAQIQLLS